MSFFRRIWGTETNLSNSSDDKTLHCNIPLHWRWCDITNNSRWRPTNRKQPTLHIGCHVVGLFHIDFDEITGHSILHGDGDSWKHSNSTWNHVSTCYRSKVITTSGFAAAILIYVHEYTKSWSNLNPNGSARLDYVEMGRKILVITATQAEIQTFPFFRLFGRHLGFAVYKIADTTVKKFDPENMGVAAGILFLSALELVIPLGGKLPPPICIIRM